LQPKKPILSKMDRKSAAEELPALYRALLDHIALIDAAGYRADGYRIRTQATRIYSRAWDEQARRALEDLLRETADRGSVRRGAVAPARRSAPVA
jgi:hypothetical protein